MALRKIIEISGKTILQTLFGSIETGDSQVSVSAYIKVLSVNGNKENATAIVRFTSDKITYDRTFDIPVSVADDAANYIKQAYQHLKSLPEFATAEDC